MINTPDDGPASSLHANILHPSTFASKTQPGAVKGLADERRRHRQVSWDHGRSLHRQSP